MSDQYEARDIPELVLQRGPDIELRIALTEFKGQQYIDVRTWWKPAGEFKPTKKGVSIPVESLDQVIQVLEAIRGHLEGEG